MEKVASLEALTALYDDTVPGAVTKVRDHLTPRYRQWIEMSRFTVLTTVGPDGTDASPRGDDGPVVKVADAKTVLLPDWRGNNRLDSLSNIVVDGRVSLMFMVPGSNNVVRINGSAVLTADEQLRAEFARGKTLPRTVIVVEVHEVYFQCAKALMRSRLWLGSDKPAGVPTAGEFLKEVEQGFDSEAYDDGYADYAKDRMW